MNAILTDINKAAQTIAAVNAAWPLMMTQVTAAWESTPNPQVDAVAKSVLAQINAVYASISVFDLPLTEVQAPLEASVTAIAQFVASIKGAAQKAAS